MAVQMDKDKHITNIKDSMEIVLESEIQNGE